MTGLLIYDERIGRFVVEELHDGVLADESCTVDLHCGNCLSVRIDGSWVNTRIEKDTDDDLFGWYFVGVGRAVSFLGHLVQI